MSKNGEISSGKKTSEFVHSSYEVQTLVYVSSTRLGIEERTRQLRGNTSLIPILDSIGA